MPEKKTNITPQIICASDVPYEPPKWLLAPYLQLGKGTLIQGDNGVGKTAFACALAAHVSTGVPLMELPVELPGEVLILSVEDDLPILRGRIEASGGNLDRCHFLANVAGLTINSPVIEDAIDKISARLVIFDPLQAFLGSGIDMHRSNETRPALAKLFDMCNRHDCACIIIAHITKSNVDKSVVNRSLGSVDIPAAMRSILHIVRSSQGEGECVAAHVKCSNAPLGPSLAFQVVDRGGVLWRGYSTLGIDDINHLGQHQNCAVPYEQDPLVRVLQQLIIDRPGGGFWSYEDIRSTGIRILGYPPCSSTADIRGRLTGSLTRELQARDGIIVFVGQRGHNGVRGIRVVQCPPPQSRTAD